MAIEPAWIGVIGAGVGALLGGLPTLGTTVVGAISAGKQRKYDAEQDAAKRDAAFAEVKAQRIHADATKRRQMASDELPQLLAMSAEWRECLRYARDADQEWLADALTIEGQPGPVHRNRAPRPNVVGDEWFEELRGHLPDSSNYLNLNTVCCDLVTVTDLSHEIRQIESQWRTRAHGSTSDGL